VVVLVDGVLNICFVWYKGLRMILLRFLLFLWFIERALIFLCFTDATLIGC
jgi:hypothetical protein